MFLYVSMMHGRSYTLKYLACVQMTDCTNDLSCSVFRVDGSGEESPFLICGCIYMRIWLYSSKASCCASHHHSTNLASARWKLPAILYT